MSLSSLLQSRFPSLEREDDFPLARHTTIGCGGCAETAVSPRDEGELCSLIAFLSKEKIPHYFLGAGANVLPPDGRYEGVAIRFCRMQKLLYREGLLFVGAGVTLGHLLCYARGHALGGFEPFTGIPATAGGATAMNAGVRDKRFSEVVERVLAVEGGKLRLLSRDDCRFSEKRSLFLGGIAVAGVFLKPELSTPERIQARLHEYRLRRFSLPKGRSMGCVFVNPRGKSAGKLIEDCGLKGLRVGRAFVSERHANFIINEGERAEDVSRLADTVSRIVRERTGISLREEFRRFGVFSP